MVSIRQPDEPNASSPSNSPDHDSILTPTEPPSEIPFDQKPYSSDPFAPNYRHICHWGEQERAEWIAEWPLPLRSDYWEVFESSENAEQTRPSAQLEVLLRRAGLEDAYAAITDGTDDIGEKTEMKKISPTSSYLDDATTEKMHDKHRKLLRDAGREDLLERAEKIWKTGERIKSYHMKEIGLESLLEMGEVTAYNYIKLTQGVVLPWWKTDTDQQDSAVAVAAPAPAAAAEPQKDEEPGRLGSGRMTKL